MENKVVGGETQRTASSMDLYEFLEIIDEIQTLQENINFLECFIKKHPRDEQRIKKYIKMLQHIQDTFKNKNSDVLVVENLYDSLFALYVKLEKLTEREKDGKSN